MVKVLFSFLSIFFLSLSIHLNPLSAQDAPVVEDAAVSEPAPDVNEAADDTAEDLGDASENVGDTGDAGDEDLADDEEFAFGTVVTVGENTLTILEYNFDTEEEVEMTYEVNAQTTYENAVVLKDIAANDEVEINFNEVDGKKVATFISKDLPIEDDTYTEEAGDESLPENVEETVQPALDNSVMPAE